MWFGQKQYNINGKTVFGRWETFDSKKEALEAGCQFISVLELDISVAEFNHWREMHQKAGNEPNRQRLTVPFRGPFFADFDRADQVGRLKTALVKALDEVVDRHRLNPDALQLWFSGSKGFHLTLPAEVFGAESFCHPRLPSIYTRFAEKLGFGTLMDHQVYSESRGRLWRVANRRRTNGLHKIPLTLDEMADWDMRRIKRLATNPRFIDPPPAKTFRKNRKLARLFETAKRDVLNAPLSSPQPSSHVRNLGHTKGELAEGLNPLEIEAVTDALNALPSECADNYGDWLRVGMALHHGSDGGEDGFQLWSAWSRQSSKYDATALERTWDSFASDRSDRITLATLFYMASKVT